MSSTLTTHVNEIESALSAYLEEFVVPRSLYEPVHYLFNAGGKRIRPLMTVLACQACGGRAEDAIPAALAIELLHNFTLVHDDIMDKSPIRRGRQTVHTQWNDSTAILSGDVMIGLALRLLSRSADTSKHPSQVLAAFATGLIEVCNGQALDLDLQTKPDATLDDYFEMITRKTARLLEASVVIGAHVAGAEAPTVNTLQSFARNIGVAFQMQDDILDLDGSEEFGKVPGGDIIEGKRTWLMLSCEHRATHPEHRALIDTFLREHGLPAEHVPHVRAMLDELGVVHDARQLVQRMTEDAFAHLRVIDDSPARASLETLGRQLMARTS